MPLTIQLCSRQSSETRIATKTLYNPRIKKTETLFLHNLTLLNFLSNQPRIRRNQGKAHTSRITLGV